MRSYLFQLSLFICLVILWDQNILNFFFKFFFASYVAVSMILEQGCVLV